MKENPSWFSFKRIWNPILEIFCPDFISNDVRDKESIIQFEAISRIPWLPTNQEKNLLSEQRAGDDAVGG